MDVTLSLGTSLAHTESWVQYPAPHRPGIVTHKCDPRWRQGDQKFTVVLDYKVSSRPVCTTGNPGEGGSRVGG